MHGRMRIILNLSIISWTYCPKWLLPCMLTCSIIPPPQLSCIHTHKALLLRRLNATGPQTPQQLHC